MQHLNLRPANLILFYRWLASDARTRFKGHTTKHGFRVLLRDFRHLLGCFIRVHWLYQLSAPVTHWNRGLSTIQ